MTLRGIFRLALLGLTLAGAGCGGLTPVNPDSASFIHVVQKGETLYSIAFNYGFDFQEVAAWNDIDPPYTIHPGEHLTIIRPSDRYVEISDPPPEVKPERPPSQAPQTVVAPAADQGKRSLRITPLKRSETGQNVVATQAKIPSKDVENSSPAPTSNTTGISWQWPVEGDVVSNFKGDSGRKGIDIKGREGDDIKAAADGDVVYSGSGLLGYGKLVIIKHNQTYLSAYGHNKKLYVDEGEKVQRGDRIAAMGESAKRGTVLHFEIRRDGKPVDPLRYLPPQNQ